MSARLKFLVIALVGVFALATAGDAFARAGGGSSFGSRGSRTFSAPSSTNTAPRAAPIQRSMTPSANQNAFGATRAPGGFFSGGFGRGLLGGLVGAGIFGLLFGHGLFGGLGGGMSIIGLILQIGLLYLLFKFVMGFFRNRQAPAFQGAAFSPGPIQGGAMPNGSGAPPRAAPLALDPSNFNMFEQRLGEVQSAFGAEDLETLRRIVTPEMASYFAEQIADNARKGQVNRLSGIKLLSGDLSEAWSEASGEYATVAMRYSLIDTMVERSSGRIVAGDPANPDTATEIWTFERRLNGTPAEWKLAAIQQT